MGGRGGSLVSLRGTCRVVTSGVTSTVGGVWAVDAGIDSTGTFGFVGTLFADVVAFGVAETIAVVAFVFVACTLLLFASELCSEIAELILEEGIPSTKLVGSGDNATVEFTVEFIGVAAVIVADSDETVAEKDSSSDVVDWAEIGELDSSVAATVVIAG